MGGVRVERRHRRTVVLVIVLTQLVVAVLTGAVISVAYGKLDRNFRSGDEIEHQTKKKHLIGGDPLNILVMGSDSRAGAGNDIDGQTDIGQRSDTTILVHVSADRKTVYGVSLPRDAMVARPECKSSDGEAPAADPVIFNDAFSLGGPKCTVEQVEALTGIYIDHYVTLDFAGFKEMVDAVHGVTVCIPEDVDDQAHGIVFKAGTQELSGQQALNYVRERYVLSANSDIGRMKRQQAFIASMINKVVSAGTLTRPSRVYNFLEAATGSITTDPGLSSLSKLVHLGWEFRRTDLSNISFITVPFEEYPPDPNRLQWAPSARGLWKVILNDQPLPKKYREQVISAATPPGTPSGTPTGSATASGSPSQSPSQTPGESASQSPSGTPTGTPEADQNGLCT
ncbi:LCP family protein [Nocardioides anomalus]|uniref:LCP family protein n=1 Tax=Nocardioides anomalus TaxID=2712223 RepID=A0A6G6WB25_9ACTN|nr:LCP family protein [Nocardioides anomalus]QIG42305.1 LCP family protein [Nocardioides anomalus]